MRFPRSSGILLHPTSLPGAIWDRRPRRRGAAVCAIFWRDAGQKLWQVLPLGPTGLRRFAVPVLLGMGRQSAADQFGGSGGARLAGASALGRRRRVSARSRRFRAADPVEDARCSNRAGVSRRLARFEAFCEQNRRWLDDFALFMALKQQHATSCGPMGTGRARSRSEGAWRMARAARPADRGAEIYQFVFFQQWRELREYAESAASASWAICRFMSRTIAPTCGSIRKYFQLDAQGDPTVVAGVPPDYFSATGQLWGNPIYRWDVLAADGYAWWLDRFRAAFAAVGHDPAGSFSRLRSVLGSSAPADHGGPWPLGERARARRCSARRNRRSANCRWWPKTWG